MARAEHDLRSRVIRLEVEDPEVEKKLGGHPLRKAVGEAPEAVGEKSDARSSFVDVPYQEGSGLNKNKNIHRSNPALDSMSRRSLSQAGGSRAEGSVPTTSTTAGSTQAQVGKTTTKFNQKTGTEVLPETLVDRALLELKKLDEQDGSDHTLINGAEITGVDNSRGFDPNASELVTSWSSYASVIYCVNTYPNGITLSVHSNDTSVESTKVSSRVEGEAAEAHAKPGLAVDPQTAAGSRAAKFLPNQFHLRFRDTRDYQLAPGKYFLHRDNYVTALESHLSQLHKSGQLANAVFYFGSSTDPFLHLHKKFDVTMNCLEIIERYAPGLVVFQTRSPMIISVLPALKNLGPKAVVVMPVETFVEKSLARYMPGKPRIGERLVAADGLRKQGIKVNLSVSPVLPYGDYFRDAWDFAELLVRHSDFITFGSLSSGAESEEKHLRVMPIAQKLVADKQFRYLRPHSYLAIYKAVQQIAPEKLVLPVKRAISPSQLNLFVA